MFRRVSLFRRAAAVLLSLLLLLGTVTVTPVLAATEETDSASRLINVVYDDSNSMIAWVDYDYSQIVSTAWSEAKYSLMILYAMMQENDVMNVYFMSDFTTFGNDEKTSAPPRLANLSGKSEHKVKNIKKILDTVTDTNGTYFNSIPTAYNDLTAKGGEYDERHLVVFTDGESFLNDQTSADLDAVFRNAPNDDVKVTYLAIGEAAIQPTPTDAVEVLNATPNNIKGEDSILNRIKQVAQRVFQRPDHPVNSGKIVLDLPASEIVVFAQGADVSIGDIDGTSKFTVGASLTEADKDKASQSPNNSQINGLQNVHVAEGLGGEIAVFKPKNGSYIPEGSYDLDIKATTYNVYYKPSLDVELTVTDKDGARVEDGADISIGTFNVDYFLTYPEGHAMHGQPIKNLDFDVDYTFTVTSGGVPQAPIHQSGPQQVELGVGNAVLSVIAKYLTYISTDTAMAFSVADYEVYDLTVTVDPEKREYILSEMEGTTDGYTVKVTHEDGSALTADEWRVCALELNSDGVDFFEPVKNNDHSFTVRPKLKNDNYEATGTGEVSFTAVATLTEEGRVTFKGSDTGIAEIYNDVIPIEKEGGFKAVITAITPDDIESTSFNDPQPTARVEITWNGNPLTKAQYDALTLTGEMKRERLVEDDHGNEVPLLSVSDVTLDPYTADGPATGTLTFLAQGKADIQRKSLDGKDDFKVTAVIERAGFTHTATDEGQLGVTRVWTPAEILGVLLVIGIILFLLFGYVICKKYLPKAIYYKSTHNPSADPEVCRPYRNFSTWLTVLIPFVPVTASIDVEFQVPVQTFNGWGFSLDYTGMKIRAKSKHTAYFVDAVDQSEAGVTIDNTARELANYRSAVEKGAPAKHPKITMGYTSSKLRKNGQAVLSFCSKH
ncbi:MAG: VWA domain-containing protein [Ruminococcaceae bacterium]|nr:VWA domain-containing protein [Oscillospiraceae bacterium]